MRIVPRGQLERYMQLAGLHPATREFPDPALCHRLTVRESDPLPFTGGPHRKVTYPDGRVEGPLLVADRPCLGRFIASVFTELKIPLVLATVDDGTFWLNNKAQAAYLHKVQDAQKVSLALRRRGLTDRFQGGFLLPPECFPSAIPLLAANTYAGGGNVLFSGLSRGPRKLTALACQHFDIHFATPDHALLTTIAEMALASALDVETLGLPELSDIPVIWSDF